MEERLLTVGPARRNNFDALRLAAAAAVVYSHQLQVTGQAQPRIGGLDIGNLAVLVFFSISGYLVTASWVADPNWPRFAARRLLRVWPAFAVVVTLSAAVVFVLDDDPPFTQMAATFYLRNLLFWRFEWVFFAANPFHNLNASLWTIPLEVECYLALAVLGVISGKWFRAAVVALALASVVGYFAAGGQEFYRASLDTGTFSQLAFVGAFFAAGSLVYLTAADTKVLLAVLCLSAPVFAIGQWMAGVVMLVPALALLVGKQSWPVLRSMGRYGDFSYGVYVWAFPLQQLGVLWLGPKAPFIVLLSLSAGSTAILAVLSWKLVEFPALRLKPPPPPRRT